MMDIKIVKKVIGFLESVDDRTIRFYVEPDVEKLAAFLDGIRIGCALCLEDEATIQRARSSVIADAEWGFNAESPAHFFLRNGFSRNRIIEELLRIELDTWNRIMNDLKNSS